LALMLIALGCAAEARAQGALPRTFTKTVAAGESSGGELSVEFDGVSASEAELDGASVTLESLPSGRTLASVGVTLRLVHDGAADRLVVRLGRRAVLAPFDGRVRVSVRLASVAQEQAALADARREVARLKNDFIDWVQQEAKTRVAYAKTSREKYFYASAGQGGGELAINPVLYDGGNVWKLRSLVSEVDLGFNFDRGTNNTSDPDSMNLGLNVRKILPLHRQSIRNEVRQLLGALRGADDALRPEGATSAAALAQTTDALRSSLQKASAEAARRSDPFFKAVVLTPLAPRVEWSLRGHGVGFLANFVNNTDVQVRTGTVPVFGSKDWTFDMKLTPLSFESGVVLNNPDDTGRRGSPLMRLNTGAVGKLTYHFPCGVDVIVNRMEFEAKAVNRHLFNDESALDRVTQKANLLVRGDKYTAQADFKFVFGFVTPVKFFRRRPAVTVSYKNGFFPPLYAYTNGVSVRVSFTSDDDTNFKDMSLNFREAQALRRDEAARP
jgi:hypothetical protein